MKDKNVKFLTILTEKPLKTFASALTFFSWKKINFRKECWKECC